MSEFRSLAEGNRYVEQFGAPSEEEKKGVLDWLCRRLNEPQALVYIGETLSPTTGGRVTIAVIRQSVPLVERRLRSSETKPDSRESRSASTPKTSEGPQRQPASSEGHSEDTRIQAEYVVGYLIDALHLALGMTFVTPSASRNASSPNE